MNSKSKVKNPLKRISGFFRKFGKFIRSSEVNVLSRKYPNAFVRIYKFPWYDVVFYLIFRHEKCTPSELSSYYASIGNQHLRISRQAASKAIKKLNPDVFKVLIRKFAEFFYQSKMVKHLINRILVSNFLEVNIYTPFAAMKVEQGTKFDPYLLKEVPSS